MRMHVCACTRMYAYVCIHRDACTHEHARTHLAVIQYSGFQKVLDRARFIGVDVRHELKRSRTLLERLDEFSSSLRQRLSEERLPIQVEEVKGKHAHAV